MGASFGSTRELAFKHVASGQTFTFPQGNGDIFAFTSEVVRVFRLCLTAWGKGWVKRGQPSVNGSIHEYRNLQPVPPPLK
jgi:hypothetical protein